MRKIRQISPIVGGWKVSRKRGAWECFSIENQTLCPPWGSRQSIMRRRFWDDADKTLSWGFRRCLGALEGKARVGKFVPLRDFYVALPAWKYHQFSSHKFIWMAIISKQRMEHRKKTFPIWREILRRKICELWIIDLHICVTSLRASKKKTTRQSC